MIVKCKYKQYAPIAQRIEHRSSKPMIKVRFLVGVHLCLVKLTDKLNGYEPFLGGSNPSRGTKQRSFA